ncbi:MAG: hypothetical protein WA021_05250 [Minisyncoccia bacterium]
MTTVFKPLSSTSGEDTELQELHMHMFLQGACYEFSLAMYQGLGWPMVGLMKGNVIWHTGVRAPDGPIWDIRGPLSEEEFSERYAISPEKIRTIATDELSAIRPLEDRAIVLARGLAEKIWPELPWLDSLQSKVVAFADELEALSRKHGFWITGLSATQLPRLYVGDADEGGYEVHANPLPFAYSITRYFKQ